MIKARLFPPDKMTDPTLRYLVIRDPIDDQDCKETPSSG
jgi:hypothetical protein